MRHSPAGLVLGLVAASLAACVAPAPEEVPVDVPELRDGWTRFDLPILELPPGEELFLCYFTTWDDDYAIVDALHWTDSPMLHTGHIVPRRAPAGLPWEDGDVVPCDQTGDWYYAGVALYESGGVAKDGGLGLPEGVGFPVANGERFVIDSHWINATEELADAHVIVDLLLLPQEEVPHPAGSFSFDYGPDLNVPPGERFSRTFDCTWHTDVTILGMGGHMHEQGVAYALDFIPEGGQPVRIIDEPEWSDLDNPPPTEEIPRKYDPDALTLRRGDAFRTTCTWENRTGQVLDYPAEMCTTYGSAYPLAEGAVCNGGGWSLPGLPGGMF